MRKIIALAAIGTSLLLAGCTHHLVQQRSLQIAATPAVSVGDAPKPLSPLETGVRLMVGDKPIAGEIGHMVPCVTDWNMDGKKDLLVGEFSGGKIQLFLNEGTDAAPKFNKMSFLEAGGKEISLPAG